MCEKFLRWGICSAGRISHDFVTAMRTVGLPAHGTNKVVAVAARSLQRAKEFADAHDIPRFYASYEELAMDPEIDVVYIGSINVEHYPLSKMMLNHGKHVLCEKTMMMNKQQTEEILNLAKEKKLFIMEAVWTRFFPAMIKLKESIESGIIGDVMVLDVSFGVHLCDIENVNSRELGGGCLLALFVYCVQLACVVFRGAGRPKSIVGKGRLFPSGVEESCCAILEYEDGKYAQLNADCRLKMHNRAYIYGTKGCIELPASFHAPTEIVLPEGAIQYPTPPEAASPAAFNYTNAWGLSYQAAAVRECILKGELECQLMPHEDTLAIIEVIDELRKQLGSNFHDN